MVITKHDEAKAVIQDIAGYEQSQETLALLKILAQSSQSLRDGKSKPARKAFTDIRMSIKKHTE